MNIDLVTYVINHKNFEKMVPRNIMTITVLRNVFGHFGLLRH